MRIIKPIQRTFRYQLRDFGTIPISRQWLFRRLLWLFKRMHCLLSCYGQIVQQTTGIGTALTQIRGIDEFAKKTFVFNGGAELATIFEAGAIVALCPAGKQIQLPVAGRLLLKAKTDSGTTSLRVLTYDRCLCSDPQPPYDATSAEVIPDGVTVQDDDYPSDNVWTLTGAWSDGERHSITVYGSYDPFSINFHADPGRTPDHLLASFGQAPGYNHTTGTYDIGFTVEGMTFTGTIHKSPAAKVGSFPPFYYHLFLIRRVVHDLI